MTHLHEEDYAAIDQLQSLGLGKREMSIDVTLEELYCQVVYTPSDIWEHLPTLRMLSSQCEHVTEFGVRGGNSTIALLAGQPKTMRSYDIVNCDIAKDLKSLQGKTDFQFIVADTRELEIEETDLLFIDTLHTAKQLRIELKQASKVKKYIVMHDTEIYARHDEGGGGEGLEVVIYTFLNNNRDWVLHSESDNNNGLTILRRDRIS